MQMEHPDLKDTVIDVPEKTAAVLKKSGWKPVPKSSQKDTSEKGK